MPRKQRPPASPPPAIRVPFPQSPESAQAWLRARGVTVASIARAHGIDRAVLVDLLRNRAKGNYGTAHRAAIVLGLKPEPDQDLGQLPAAA